MRRYSPSIVPLREHPGNNPLVRFPDPPEGESASRRFADCVSNPSLNTISCAALVLDVSHRRSWCCPAVAQSRRGSNDLHDGLELPVAGPVATAAGASLSLPLSWYFYSHSCGRWLRI